MSYNRKQFEKKKTPKKAVKQPKKVKSLTKDRFDKYRNYLED